MARNNSLETIQKTLDLAGQELGILHQISQSISCTLDLDQVLAQIIDLVIDVTHGDSCLVYLLDEAGANLVLRGSKNPHPRLIGKIELKVGETYPVKIIKLAPEERKIGLSIRALKSDEFRADWEAYQESAGDGSATLGEHFRNK